MPSLLSTALYQVISSLTLLNADSIVKSYITEISLNTCIFLHPVMRNTFQLQASRIHDEVESYMCFLAREKP